jgi:hypothetical protein
MATGSFTRQPSEFVGQGPGTSYREQQSVVSFARSVSQRKKKQAAAAASARNAARRGAALAAAGRDPHTTEPSLDGMDRRRTARTWMSNP